MATSKRTRRTLRCAALAVVSVLVVGLGPGVGQADPPPTSADVKRQVLALGDQLEIVTEEYNAANIALGRAKTAQSQAEARAAALQAQLESLSGKVRQMASSVYRSAPFSEFTTMLTSGSPDEFLNQLSTLDALSHRRDATLTSLQQASTQAGRAQQAATEAAADAQKIFNGLRAKKTAIEQQLAKQQALLRRLTAQERAELFADPPAPAERADRETRPPPTVDASGKAKIAIDAAMSKLGSPYVWAADGPSTFDCSGLTMWAWAQAGVSLPHQSAMQYDVGTHVSYDELKPGDLVFFYSPIHHVGLYIGGGKMVHAPTSGDVVKVSSMNMANYTGATRVG